MALFIFVSISLKGIIHVQNMDSNEDDSLLWLFVIADHVRYMVYAVITDDCRRPDLGFTATERHTALQHSASRNTH